MYSLVSRFSPSPSYMKLPISDIKDKVGQKVVLAGWINQIRDKGKMIFLELRDRSGTVQIVCLTKDLSGDINKELKKISLEACVTLTGVVQKREGEQKNDKDPMGEYEILLSGEEAVLKVLAEAEPLPVEVYSEERLPAEELRLKYRYLDLRRGRLQNNLILRARLISALRKFLDKAGFIEFETPLLTRSTPEGARDFLVPTRSGKFFALPQSPQQYKQLLMVSGFEKYYQIAKCFRDEDSRGDRQPEFTQLDVEMSFVEREDILSLTEKLFTEVLAEVAPDHKITATPWPRLTYAEAMKNYGSDKPDLRADKNDPKELAFAWILDFPLFEKTDAGALTSSHHPFTAPHPDDIEMLDKEPASVRSQSYDIVLNGYEIASGSIRIYQSDLQQKIFQILGLKDDEIEEKFGHLLRAFKYGPPPHGGIAPGIDRLVMILAGEPNIREVIAFPKTSDGKDLLMASPSEVSEEQLKELGLNKLD